MPKATGLVVAIVQARLGSVRLPGKSMLPLPLGATGDATTLLGHVISRACQATSVNQVLVATTTQPLDDELAALALRLGTTVVRGDEHDVLARFIQALDATSPAVTTVVRLTADNPALDPAFMDAAVAHHLRTGADYTLTTGLPLGTNIEVIAASALRRAHREAHLRTEREHVTPYLRQHPNLFRLETLSLRVSPAVAALRLTVDYPSDYELLSLLFGALGTNFSLTDPAGLPALLIQRPWLGAMNMGNEQQRP